MFNLVKRFAREISAVTGIEYSLIATLVSISIIIGASMVGCSLDAGFTELANNLNVPL
jgi:Flp pilus assembly pilin Flp